MHYLSGPCGILYMMMWRRLYYNALGNICAHMQVHNPINFHVVWHIFFINAMFISTFILLWTMCTNTMRRSCVIVHTLNKISWSTFLNLYMGDIISYNWQTHWAIFYVLFWIGFSFSFWTWTFFTLLCNMTYALMLTAHKFFACMQASLWSSKTFYKDAARDGLCWERTDGVTFKVQVKSMSNWVFYMVRLYERRSSSILEDVVYFKLAINARYYWNRGGHVILIDCLWVFVWTLFGVCNLSKIWCVVWSML